MKIVLDCPLGCLNQISISSGSQQYCCGSTPANWCASRASGARVPTKKELESLIDFANVSPAMDGAVFTTDSYLFGTSTVVSGSGGSHWGVDFTDGRTVTIGQATYLYVRCVI